MSRHYPEVLEDVAHIEGQGAKRIIICEICGSKSNFGCSQSTSNKEELYQIWKNIEKDINIAAANLFEDHLRTEHPTIIRMIQDA